MRDPNCEKCPLHYKAQHVCMAGRGMETKPFIAFVGQAPGKDEDLKGLPFVGPAGQLLQQAIDEYNLKPNFITNVVRCFPGRNAKGRDIPPTAGQIEACRPYLDEELGRVKPKYIVAVGGHALEALTGRSGITTWAGQIAGKWNGIPVFAMLHPSYILTREKELPKFESHAKALAELINPSIAKPHPKVTQVSVAEAKLILPTFAAAAFDIETSTQWPWQGGHIRTISWSDGKKHIWLKVEGDPAALELVRLFMESRTRKIIQNLVFESIWSLWLFGIVPKYIAHDPMLMAHLINENGPKDLKLMAQQRLGAPAYDIKPLMRANNWDWATVPIKELGPYNGLDSAYTSLLVPGLYDELDEGQRWCYANILLPLAQLCARMTVRGMHVDHDWAARVVEKYSAEMVELDKKIRATPEVRRLEAGLKKGQTLNYRSPVQMQKLLFDYLKLPIGPRTPSGQPSTDSKYLERLKNPPVLLTNYLEWKSRETMNGKFMVKFPTYADPDDLIHADISPAFIVTGRTAVSEPPLHGMPKGVRVNGKFDGLPRGMFNSRFEGGKMISADYKALEFRLVCSEANETKFIEAFKGGMDPHAITAEDLFGKGWKPADRDKAKTTNFSIIYGITEFSLAPKLGVTEEEALRIIIAFRKKHPQMFVWMERQYDRVRRECRAISRFGRVRHLPDVTGMEEWKQEAVFREAGNFPIQSAGADITNLASIELDRRMRAEKLESKLVLNYHDALYVDAHPDEVEFVSTLIVKVMKDEIPGKLSWLKLPLDVDLKVEDRWGGAKWPETASSSPSAARSTSAISKA